MNTTKIKTGKTLMVAHRGLSGIETENTCAAFVAAGNRSYYGIETDIHQTADGKYILIHDGNTKRVSGDVIEVEESTYSTLRKVQLKNKNGKRDRSDLRLPSLEEYISICKKYEKVSVLELKSAYTKEQIQEIIDRIVALDYLDQVLFISFKHDNLRMVREILPEQPCQFLTSTVTDALLDELIEEKIGLDVDKEALTEEIIQKLHAHGLEVNCWTVDDKEEAEKYISWGIDYITTNILESES